MREILFKGFHECKEGAQKAYYGGAWHDGEWIRGNLINYPDVNRAYIAAQEYKPAWGAKEVAMHTIGQYTGLMDKHGEKIFEGDIVRFNDDADFDIHAMVRIGEYSQDGSGGEYRSAQCFGVYYEIVDFTRPDWAEQYADNPSEYENAGSLLSSWIIGSVEVIGNIHDSEKED